MKTNLNGNEHITSSIRQLYSHVYDRMHAQIEAFARRRRFGMATPEEIEEIVQEVFLRLWVALACDDVSGIQSGIPDCERVEDAVSKWILGVTRNVAKESWRRSKRAFKTGVDLEPLITGDESDTGFLSIDIDSALCRCTPEERVVFLLLQDHTQKEVAQLLSVNRSTVVRRYANARAQLQQLLGE